MKRLCAFNELYGAPPRIAYERHHVAVSVVTMSLPALHQRQTSRRRSFAVVGRERDVQAQRIEFRVIGQCRLRMAVKFQHDAVGLIGEKCVNGSCSCLQDAGRDSGRTRQRS